MDSVDVCDTGLLLSLCIEGDKASSLSDLSWEILTLKI